MQLSTLIFFLLALLVTSSTCIVEDNDYNYNLDTLSPLEINQLIISMKTQIIDCNNLEQKSMYLSRLDKLLELNNKNMDHTSWYYKISSVAVLTQILSLLIIVFLIIFVTSLFQDIVITFSLESIIFIKKILNGNIKFYACYVMFGLPILFECIRVQYLGDTAVIVHLLFLYIISYVHLDKNYKDKQKVLDNKTINNFLLFWCIVTAIVSIFNNNNFVGTVTILLLLIRNGMSIINLQSERNSQRALKSTSRLCLLLTSIFGLIKLNLVMPFGIIDYIYIIDYIRVFEVGTLFWCPLFSFCALLIVCDMDSNKDYPKPNLEITGRCVTFIMILVHIVIGIIAKIDYLVTLGCTFIIIWLFFLELEIIKKNSVKKVWILSLVILINLIGLYYITTNHPGMLLIN